MIYSKKRNFTDDLNDVCACNGGKSQNVRKVFAGKFQKGKKKEIYHSLDYLRSDSSASLQTNLVV